MKKKTHFVTEAEMCAAFIAELSKEWTAYAETAGWDILLVRKADSFQIGIQAKLRLNAIVLNQALESRYSHDVGPDCRAILVPEGATGRLAEIATALGLTIITARRPDRFCRMSFPDLPRAGSHTGDWHERCPIRRHKLPDYVPDVAAGAPSPLQLTSWKIAAIKIAVTLERRGFVTRTDFKTHNIDPRRWLSQGWLQATDGKLLAGSLPDFKQQHPVVYEQIAADASKWMPA